MPKIGVSACVMGDKVRYDGGHKQSSFVTQQLQPHVTYQPICPELGIGMPVPRPTIHLREMSDGVHLTDSRNGLLDHTEAMQQFFARQLPILEQLDGYVVAAKSPSCGMERIKVYDSEGQLLHRAGQGLFTQLLKAHFPHLPVEEDGRLNDAGLRESFITRVFVYHEFRHKVMASLSVHALVKFHSRHKLLVMAYSPVLYRALGRLVAQAKGQEHTIAQEYLALMMQALSKPTNRRKHTNVLMHMQGYFKRDLMPADKRELSQQIDDYRLGRVPLLAPVTLLKHHLRHFPNAYLAQQSYFDPYPQELGLRA